MRAYLVDAFQGARKLALHYEPPCLERDLVPGTSGFDGQARILKGGDEQVAFVVHGRHGAQHPFYSNIRFRRLAWACERQSEFVRG